VRRKADFPCCLTFPLARLLDPADALSPYSTAITVFFLQPIFRDCVSDRADLLLLPKAGESCPFAGFDGLVSRLLLGIRGKFDFPLVLCMVQSINNKDMVEEAGPVSMPSLWIPDSTSHLLLPQHLSRHCVSGCLSAHTEIKSSSFERFCSQVSQLL
jgi:hypothetical protein